MGVTHALNEMGYQTQYFFSQDPAEISSAAANADAAITLYATTTNVHYVAFNPDPINQSTQVQTFTFYNETGKAGDSRTYENFNSSLTNTDRAKIGAITILVNK